LPREGEKGEQDEVIEKEAIIMPGRSRGGNRQTTVLPNDGK